MIIRLSGHDVIVDDEDVEKIQSRHWYINKKQKEKYDLCYFYNDLVVNKKKESIILHRFIMGCERGDKKIIDHIDGNTLDCRKSNLRVCRHQDNIRNSKPRVMKTYTAYKGVERRNDHSKWTARIVGDDGVVYLGSFTNEQDAARAYDIGALYYYKEFARLNLDKDLYKDLNIEQEFEKYKLKFHSQYRGVGLTRNKTFTAYISKDKARYHLGCFPTEEEAAEAYNSKALELYGDKARLNVICI